jgi:hypothetical protein
MLLAGLIMSMITPEFREYLSRNRLIAFYAIGNASFRHRVVPMVNSHAVIILATDQKFVEILVRYAGLKQQGEALVEKMKAPKGRNGHALA